MKKVRTIFFLMLGIAVIARLALAVSEDELQSLDEETKRYVLSEQKRIEEESKVRASEEAQTMKRKKTVFDWPLNQKIEVLRSGPPFPDGVDEALVREMLYAELAKRYSNAWKENPRGLLGLREQMENLRTYIMDLSDSPRSSDKSYAVKFGKYLKVDEEVDSMLYKVLDQKLAKNESGVREVLDVIFGYKLDSQNLRDELVQGLSLEESVSSKSRFGKEAELDAGEWGLSEAVESLMRLVEDRYERTGKINRTAVKSLQELGGDAANVLSRLRALLDQALVDKDAGFREIEALRHALSAIENDLHQKQSTSASSEPNFSEKAKASAKTTSINEQAVDIGAAESREKPAEQSSNWWVWLIGAVVIAGGIGLLVRRKS